MIRSVALGTLLIVGASTLAAQEVDNLARQSAGGHLVFFASQYDTGTWQAQHLIDGTPNNGWAGQSSGAQAIVLAFADDRLAEIHDILINPYTQEDKSNWVKDVEIQVSTTYPFRDFTSLGQFRLKNEGGGQLFSPPQPVQARYVKVVCLSNYGGAYMEAGEIEVMGRLLPAAPPAPRWTELAAAERGGRVERFSSEYDNTNWAASNLLAPDGKGQWAGKSRDPQEVVIALPTLAEISDLAVNNYAREAPKNWAREVTVEVSSTSSYKDFRPVGKLSLPQVGDLHILTLARPVEAKYVKLLFGSNHGGAYMEAARVRIFHAPPPEGGRIAAQLETTGRAVAREIHFAFNSAEILPESAGILNEIGGLLKAHAAWELIIEGHTDNVGGAPFNLQLSRQRAEAVKWWLVNRAGVGEARLTTVGYGQDRPVADNSTEVGRAQNRRVELVRK